MSIYYVTVGKNEYQVEINENSCKINGEFVQATLVALKEHGVHLLRRGLNKREIHVKAQGKSQYLLDIKGLHAHVKVGKNKALQSRSADSSAGDLISPLPGQVVSVHVSEGDQVEQGQILLVMESMKMQMVLHAACSGKVMQVEAQAGKVIAKGAMLVRIEKE